MKKYALLFTLFFFIAIAAFCQNNYWQQQTDYTITVNLNDTNHSLDGQEKIVYHNNSPDTLYFIWIHLWPNAYKNDQTAFSEQLLKNGRTDFYFSSEENRGYINQLNFKVNGTIAATKDHQEHQDIVQLLLPQPLLPKSKVLIETSFHVKLPFNYSRGGHVGQSYQITQWYPKPAVYDRQGWHPMPYLDQGEFYGEFGNYEVQVTVPANYTVAATGELINEAIEPAISLMSKNSKALPTTIKHPPFLKTKMISDSIIASAIHKKHLTYRQNKVHDFAWFASKSLLRIKDTLQLPSGKVIEVAAYFEPKHSAVWRNSIALMKQSILTRSEFLGEYPYQTVSAVEAKMGVDGGMEYPTITAITPVKNEAELESVLEHEIGHNWNYGVLATNERMAPWMDEGINTFYDNRYYSLGSNIIKSNQLQKKSSFIQSRMPQNLDQYRLANLYATKDDQPIATPADQFSAINYSTIAYYKTGEWMQLLETKLGKTLFDSCMQTYFKQWQFKHPTSEDFKNVMQTVGKNNLDSIFNLLLQKGALLNTKTNRPLHFKSFFSFNSTDKYRYIFGAPAIGMNAYDKLMLGALVHNYTLPEERFQFLVAPMYGTGSQQWNGIGRWSYRLHAGENGSKLTLSLAAETFSGNAFTDSSNKKTTLRFSKIALSLQYIFANNEPTSSITKFIQWKTFFINEQHLLFSRDTILNKDNISFPSTNRYINQLRFVVDNPRALYPYNGEWMAEQSNNFLRLSFTGNYYFNYANGGGMNVRFFAGKFLYLGERTFMKQFETDAYHLNMSGPKGNEDYTYSNYFAGRNDYNGLSSQQIMNRDGFFKVRTDLLNSKVGKTDDWLMAANFTTAIPKAINILQILPFNIPLKVFVDIGSYAEAWQKNAATGKIIYDAGLQVSLLKNMVQVYFPILYSKVYSDYFKSTIAENRFVKNISFSIDIQQFRLQKAFPQLAF